MTRPASYGSTLEVMKEISSTQPAEGDFLAVGSKWPRIYRIVMEGRIDPCWSDRLAGMVISPQKDDGRDAGTTVLQGPIRDRSELSGLLNTISDLGLAPVSLAMIDHGSGETPPDPKPAT